MDVEQISDDGGHALGYLVKGHVSDAEIENAIRQQTSYDTFEIAHAKSIERIVMRKIPTPWHDTWSLVYEYSEPGRGAFKCTVAWLKW